ncbi:SusE domain-containing protein [Bizionia sp. KMM 8389]
MKTIKIIAAIFLLSLGFQACQSDDDLEFVAQSNGEFVFTNTFLEQYVLSPESDVNDNIGVTFNWNPVSFDTPTNVSYVVQNSILGDFTDAQDVSEVTSETFLTLSIGTLKNLAETAGLEAPDTGVLNFRVRAYVGDNISTTESFSNIQPITVVLPEAASGGSGIEMSTWGIVGSGYNNWGGFADAPFYTTSEANVFVAYATLVTGEIKFRENNEWVNDFGDNDADGSLEAGGSNIAVTDGTYKITLNLNDNTYSMEAYSWGIVGSGYNDWGATPDAKFYYDYTTDTFKTGVHLIDGEIKFRQNNEWTTDFGDTGADGTLDAGGENIVVTEGHYLVTIDFNTNTYTIVEDDIFGIVGSGYNDWGATADFSLTEVQPDILVGDIVALVDGEIKFRANNDWATDYGDTGADGTLDVGGENIAVTAGLYRVKLDLVSGNYELNLVQ